MSLIKDIKTLGPSPREVVAAISWEGCGHEKQIFVRNKHNKHFYAVGYSSCYESYYELLAYHPNICAIYEGESVTLEF
jgi:hypothetical protein